MTDKEINELSYMERCEILNSNPVLVARHFQFRVETFFKIIVVNGPLGKVNYYAIRVEFQFRGSPHIHSFLWVLNAPKLTNDTKERLWMKLLSVTSRTKTKNPNYINSSKLVKRILTLSLAENIKTQIAGLITDASLPIER